MTDSFLPLDGGGEVGAKESRPRNLSVRYYISLQLLCSVRRSMRALAGGCGLFRAYNLN